MLRKISFAMFGLALLLLLVVALAVIFEGGDSQKTAQEKANQTERVAEKEEADSPPERWKEMDKSEEMQQKRKDYIQNLKEKGVIDHVDVSQGLIKIYVGPIWNKIKFDTKEASIDGLVTYYYAQDPEMNSAVLRDPYTNKKIGRFDKYGLDLN